MFHDKEDMSEDPDLARRLLNKKTFDSYFDVLLSMFYIKNKCRYLLGNVNFETKKCIDELNKKRKIYQETLRIDWTHKKWLQELNEIRKIC